MCDGHSDVLVDIGNKVISVDRCIAPLVKLLNDGGWQTIASCCGHGNFPGTIALFDLDGNERWLILTRDRAEGERLAFPDNEVVTRARRAATTLRRRAADMTSDAREISYQQILAGLAVLDPDAARPTPEADR